MSKAYASYPNFLVKILEAVDFHLAQVVDGLAGCEGACHGRVVRDLARHGLATDRTRFADRLLAFRRIHDEADFVVLDHVDDVRATFPHLVGAAASDTRRLERSGCAVRGDDLKTLSREALAQLDRARFVAFAHADEAYPARRQGHTRRRLRLGISLAETAARAHDF